MPELSIVSIMGKRQTLFFFLLGSSCLVLIISWHQIVSFNPSLDASIVVTTLPPEELFFTAVTFNLWRLCDSPRVPLIVDALHYMQQDLMAGTGTGSVPDILLFQEIECEAVTAELQQALAETHWSTESICDWQSNGEPRSGVAMAINRTKFVVEQRNLLDLGRLFGDHRRCGLHLLLKSRENAAQLHVVNIHHSPHPLKGRQTEQLINQLQKLGIDDAKVALIGGDFNFGPTSTSYAELRQWFDDPFPENRGKTHWLGGRIDLLFVNSGLSLVRPLNRAIAHKVIRPTKLFRPLYRCPRQQWSACALSDHFPEGGLFKIQP